MTPEELQANFVQAVLYYCGVTTSDPTRFFGYGTSQISPEIGVIDYLPNTSDYTIVSWELKSDMPTNEDLALPSLVDVLVFYEKAYQNPENVNMSQPFAKLTTSQMNDMEITYLRQDSLVTNTTVNRNYKLRGTSWVIGDPQPIHQSQHNGIVSNVTFSAGQVKEVHFTSTLGTLNSGFELDDVTGVITYKKQAKNLKITFLFSVNQHSVSTSGEMEHFVNINGNVTSVPTNQQRSSTRWNATSSLADFNRVNVVVKDTIFCEPETTIALGGYLADGLSQGLDYYDIRCQIEGTNF